MIRVADQLFWPTVSEVERPPRRLCAYCGFPLDGGNRSVCSKHATLPALDPGWHRFLFGRWWLARFTEPELVVLKASLYSKQEPAGRVPQGVQPDRLHTKGV